MGGVHAARVASWLVVALTVAVLAGASLLDALSSRSTEAAWLSFVFPFAVVMSTGVGLVVTTRRRDNPIGWLLLANGFVLAFNGLAANYAAYGLLERPGSLPGAAWAVLFDQSGWPTVFAAFTAIASSFPTAGFHHPVGGRSRTRRSRRSLSFCCSRSFDRARSTSRSRLSRSRCRSFLTRSSSLPSPSPPLACSRVSLQRRSPWARGYGALLDRAVANQVARLRDGADPGRGRRRGIESLLVSRSDTATARSRAGGPWRSRWRSASR